MRLSDHLLLQRAHGGVFLLIDETSDSQIELEPDDIARVALGALYYAAVHPAIKEAIIAQLLDQDVDRRVIVGRVVMDAAEDLRRMVEAGTRP